MTATAHALVAGALASRFTDPGTAGVMALTSHFIMDSIPHWDFGTNWRSRAKQTTGMFAILETVIGIWLSYYFFGRHVPISLWATTVIAALIPDWIETPWYIFYANQNKHVPHKNAGVIEKISYAFYKIPNVFHAKTQLPLGIITQIATVAFFVILLG